MMWSAAYERFKGIIQERDELDLSVGVATESLINTLRTNAKVTEGTFKLQLPNDDEATASALSTKHNALLLPDGTLSTIIRVNFPTPGTNTTAALVPVVINLGSERTATVAGGTFKIQREGEALTNAVLQAATDELRARLLPRATD